MRLEAQLKARLEEQAQQGLQRRRRIVAEACRPHCTVEGRPVLAFASNDYLGLAADPVLIDVMVRACQTWGVGSGASHLVSGHFTPHDCLEEELARFTGFPRALGFSSGYLANLALLPTLAGRGDAIFADKLNHASLIDSVRLSRAQSYRYPHKDVAALETMLQQSTARTKLIVTDAVFSMDGDMAPLPQLFELAQQFDAWLIIDDAHGFGILGPRGEGTLAHLGVTPHPRILLMATLGKAAGVSGAFIAGSALAVDTLLQNARSYIFTTAQAPVQAQTLLAALEQIQGTSGQQRRKHLQTLIQRLKFGLADLPWSLMPSSTAIQPLLTGSNEATLHLSQALWERGIWVPAIRPPTVPAGKARLRISLSAAHTLEDVEQLVHCLRELA